MRIALFLLLILLAGCSGERAPAPPKAGESRVPAPKITQFYASKPSVPKGESSLLCYGVESAAAVRVEPPVEKLSPALTRCFEVKPVATTTYTLTAEGRDGATVTAQATVNVGGARPRLADLQINKEKVRPGEQVRFCFVATNATTVRGSPGRFLRGGRADKDCLLDNPTKTTMYTITVSNGQQLTDSASITVQVAP